MGLCCKLENLRGVRPSLLVPALYDDLVVCGGLEPVKVEAARVGEAAPSPGVVVVAGHGRDDVGPLGVLLGRGGSAGTLLLLLLLLLLLQAGASAREKQQQVSASLSCFRTVAVSCCWVFYLPLAVTVGCFAFSKHIFVAAV